MTKAQTQEDSPVATEENLYRICHLVVQRARQIQGGTPSLVPSSLDKPTSKALEELSQGKIRAYTRDEWEREMARLAEEAPAPLEEVLELEEAPKEQVEDSGGFAGFLSAVMSAKPAADKKKEAPVAGEGGEASGESGE